MIDRAKLEAAIQEAPSFQGIVGGRSHATITVGCYHALLEAASAHLATLPKTKMVEVWHVCFWSGGSASVWARVSQEDAENAARSLRVGGAHGVRVTGPHQQCVPAE